MDNGQRWDSLQRIIENNQYCFFWLERFSFAVSSLFRFYHPLPLYSSSSSPSSPNSPTIASSTAFILFLYANAHLRMSIVLLFDGCCFSLCSLRMRMPVIILRLMNWSEASLWTHWNEGFHVYMFILSLIRLSLQIWVDFYFSFFSRIFSSSLWFFSSRNPEKLSIYYWLPVEKAATHTET